MIVATDAPLTPDQLKRLARRVSVGLGRVGAIEGDESGDIFLAFSPPTQELTRATALYPPSLPRMPRFSACKAGRWMPCSPP